MPGRYGKWATIYNRFQRWRKSGVWDKMFAELQTALDVENNVDWEIHFIDSTIVRAHHVRLGQKSNPERETLGRSHGGFSTKIHIRCEGPGRLITFLLTPSQESVINLAEELMETGAIRRSSFNKSHYHIIERLINRLKQFRRIVTPYEKRAANFSAF